MKREKFLRLCAITGARVRIGYYIVDCGLHIQTTPQPTNFVGGWSAFWAFVHSKNAIAYYFDGLAVKEIKEHTQRISVKYAINPTPSVEERQRWSKLSTLSKREVETRDNGHKATAFDEGCTARPDRRRAKNNAPILIC